MTAIIEIIKHFHLFCGAGGGAMGFNQGEARIANMEARLECLGGVDSDPAGIADFERFSRTPGTLMDLFSLEQYIDFHGEAPPPGWQEVTPADLLRTCGYRFPNINFLSPPCKGNSGLLSEAKSKTKKYQALNALALRGIWLCLEAFKDDPSEFYILENVLRMAQRSRGLIDQIKALFYSYGYVCMESWHDCGELGALAQTRKRFLLVARHINKVPNFLYEPEKKPLRAVGDILQHMPVPGEGRGGPMHRVPALQFKTWIRLALIRAGKDWRDLKNLRVSAGKLVDYAIMPETRHNSVLGVNPWDESMGTVAGRSMPYNGTFSIQDPMVRNSSFHPYGVIGMKDTAHTIGAGTMPGQGYYSIAEPRVNFDRSGPLGVNDWDKNANTVPGESFPTNGPHSISDVRMNAASDTARHKNVFRIVSMDEFAGTISGGHGPSSGGQCIADARHLGPAKHNNEFRIVPYDQATGPVTGAHGTGQCLADPRPNWEKRYGNLNVGDWNRNANTVIAGGKGVQGGWLSIADPGIRKGASYVSGGHYGVLPWERHSLTVSGSASYDNSFSSVADPRIPDESDNLVCVIRALDGTWHRPFTTLELAALQSLYDPEDPTMQPDDFIMHGNSDSAWRERIGNMVPPKSAKAIAGVMATAILLARSGQTFQLSNVPIWVRPVAMSLSIRQPDMPL